MDNQIINKQISEIQAKENISNVAFMQHNTYKITYSPIKTNSPYSQLVFPLKIIIPHKYPESPPNLVFLTNIYHLNVDPVTGQVHMPILSDDWSPYLTLSNVIESLDNILEQPDLNYPATQFLREQYELDFQTYAQKLNKMIQLSLQSNENFNESIVEHVEQLNYPETNIQQYQIINNGLKQSTTNKNQTQQNKLNLTYQKNNQMLIQQGSPSNIQNNEVINQDKSDIIYLQEVNQKNRNQNRNKNVIQQIIYKPLTHKKSTINDRQLKKSMNSNKISQVPIYRQEQSSSQFQNIYKNLIKNDQLVQALIKTCQMMQGNLKTTSNPKLKQMIGKQLQKQWQMVQQLFNLSSKLKLKLYTMIKKQSQQLLK